MRNQSRTELLIILGTLTAFGALSIDMYLPALPTLETVFSARTSQVQLTLTTFFLGYALGQSFYGPITDRFGRKPPLYASLTLYTLASIGCVFAPSVEAMMVLRLLQALGGCAGSVIARAMVRDLFDVQEMRRILSILMLVLGVAPILAPLFGGQLLRLFGWQSIFWVLALIGMLSLLAVHFRLLETHPADPTQRINLRKILIRYYGLLQNRTFVVNVVAGGIASAGMFAYIAGSPFVFIDYFGVSSDQFALFFGFNALGLVLSSQANAYLLQDIRPDKVLFTAIAIQCVAGFTLIIAALTGVGGLPGVAIPLFIYVTCNGLVFPNATALAMEPFGRDAGAASALLGTLQSSFGAIVTALVGALEGAGEGAIPMASVIAACGFIALTLYFLYSGIRVQERTSV